MQYLCCFAKALQHSLFQYGLFSARFVPPLQTIFTSDITIQSAVFLVVSLVSLIVTRPLVKRFKKRNKTTGTNADRHIGQVGFMLTDLTDIDETAQAKVGAETWTVKSDKAPLSKGTKVKVLAIEGVKLIVEPVTE